MTLQNAECAAGSKTAKAPELATDQKQVQLYGPHL